MVENTDIEVTGLWWLYQKSETLTLINIRHDLAGYTVEMVAILVALKYVQETRGKKVFIWSDSSAVLASLRSFQSNSQSEGAIWSFTPNRLV